MKKLTIILAAILISCGPSSEKGNWNDSDMSKCISDGNEEIRTDVNISSMIESVGVDGNEFSTCVCNRLEERFDSYYVADLEMNDVSDEEAVLMIAPCLGEEFMNLINSLDSLDLE